MTFFNFGCFKRRFKKPPGPEPESKYRQERRKRELPSYYQSKMDLKNGFSNNTDLKIIDEEEKREVVVKPNREEKRYFDFEYICQGFFAKVYKAKDINNKPVAVKRINIKNNPRFYEIAKRECSLLNSINSKHIIKLQDAFVNEPYLYMILPLYKMDLFEYLPKLIGKPNKIFKILLGIAKGLRDLHQLELMHGDIKPENIMLTDDNEPIIIDLGLSKSYKVYGINDHADRCKNLSGTLLYLPPEVIQFRSYTEKMDIWAFGVIMYMLMFNQEPFEIRKGETKEEIFNNIKYKEQFYPLRWRISEHTISRDLVGYVKIVELNKWLLMKDRNERPNINQVILELESINDHLRKTTCDKSCKLSHDLMVSHLNTFKTM